MGQFADFLDNVEVCLSTKGSVATKQCGEAFGAFCDMIKNAASRNLVPGASMPSKPSLAKPGRDYVEIRRMETGYEVPITERTSCAIAPPPPEYAGTDSINSETDALATELRAENRELRAQNQALQDEIQSLKDQLHNVGTPSATATSPDGKADAFPAPPPSPPPPPLPTHRRRIRRRLPLLRRRVRVSLPPSFPAAEPPSPPPYPLPLSAPLRSTRSPPRLRVPCGAGAAAAYA